MPEPLGQQWRAHPIASSIGVWLAYTLGFIAATCICLPTFYFYGLLAGVKLSVMQVTAHIMKATVGTALALLGILPIYFAIMLGAVVFHFQEELVRRSIILGLALPFLAGLWGVGYLYRSFSGLADTMPAKRRCQRECFLRRLTFACTFNYAVVAPVMIYFLWNEISHALT